MGIQIPLVDLRPGGHGGVQDPLFISFVAFCLCGTIAYFFTMLLDHASDVILYTYAWNKKCNKKTCEKFMPEGLKDIVGIAHLEADSYPLYGKADANMYLASWMGTGKATEKKKPPKPTASKAEQGYASMGPGMSQMQPGMTGMLGGAGQYGASPYGASPHNLS